MRVFDKRKPNVRSLARKGDVDGLIAAAGHSAVLTGPDGPVDAGAGVREEALFALRDIAPDRAGHVFAAGLADPSDRVRCAAVVAVYAQRDSGQLAKAVASLPASGKSRGMAARALLELHEPGTSAALVTALVHRKGNAPLDDSETALVPALIRAEEDAAAVTTAVDLLVAALADERDIVAQRAERLLLELRPASTDALVAELADGAAAHRAAVILAAINDPRTMHPLMQGLTHTDSRVRSQCAYALGELRDPAAVERLLEATRDSDHEVRVRAGAALDRMGTAAVAVSVAALLRENGDTPARDSMAEILLNGGWEEAASSILPDDLSAVEGIEVIWEGDESNDRD
jgi:HEAT repeat protein